MCVLLYYIRYQLKKKKNKKNKTFTQRSKRGGHKLRKNQGLKHPERKKQGYSGN